MVWRKAMMVMYQKSVCFTSVENPPSRTTVAHTVASVPKPFIALYASALLRIKKLSHSSGSKSPMIFQAVVPLCFLAILAMGLIADTRTVSHMMSSTKHVTYRLAAFVQRIICHKKNFCSLQASTEHRLKYASKE